MILAQKFIFFIISFFLFLLSTRIYAEDGFYSPNDPRFPAPVLEASRSVVALKSVAGRRVGFIDLSTEELQKVNIQWAKKNDQFFTLTQIEFCIQHQLKYCPQFANSGEGSAFFLGDSKTMATTLHNSIWYIQSFHTLGTYADFKNLLGHPVYAGIGDLDTNGELKYIWPKQLGSDLKLSFVTDDLNYISLVYRASEFQTVVGRNFDYVELKFDKDTYFKPLFLSKEQPIPGSMAYIIGFPMFIKNSSGSSPKYKENENRKISYGRVLSTDEFIQLANEELIEISKLDLNQIQITGIDSPKKAVLGYRQFISESISKFELLDQHALFVDGDCSYGNSGGPIVNENGEVIAVLQEVITLWSKNNKSICVGLKNITHEKLKDTWSRLSTKSSKSFLRRWISQESKEIGGYIKDLININSIQ